MYYTYTAAVELLKLPRTKIFRVCALLGIDTSQGIHEDHMPDIIDYLVERSKSSVVESNDLEINENDDKLRDQVQLLTEAVSNLLATNQVLEQKIEDLYSINRVLEQKNEDLYSINQVLEQKIEYLSTQCVNVETRTIKRLQAYKTDIQSFYILLNDMKPLVAFHHRFIEKYIRDAEAPDE